jgi:transcriptional/translational regulatory protein YebC/TACO1
VAAALEASIKTAATSTALIWKPLNTVPVEGENADKLMSMIEELEDCDDVQNVYGNYELSDAEMARLAG